MKKLCELCELVENNEKCVVYKVKDNSCIELIKLGCFNGDETMFRISKETEEDAYLSCTYWASNGKYFTWQSHELVSDVLKKVQKMLYDMTVWDFGINVIGKYAISKTLNIHNINERKHFDLEVSGYIKKNECVNVHRDGTFLENFNTIDEFITFIDGLYGEKYSIVKDIAPTGCDVWIFHF